MNSLFRGGLFLCNYYLNSFLPKGYIYIIIERKYSQQVQLLEIAPIKITKPVELKEIL